MRNSIFSLLISVFALGCRSEYLAFDRHPPGLVPKVFAKDVISKNDEHVGYCAFSPDGSVLYYAETTADWSTSKIIKISSRDLAKKETLYLKDKRYEGEPFITRDGKTMYFTVILPPPEGKPWQSDIYRVHKTATGWGPPELLGAPINSPASEWHVSMTDKNVIYFVSEREKGTSALNGDIYRAEQKGDTFVNLTKLPYSINTDYNDSDPLIAPDESFLIFHSNRAGGFGEHDLYISFNHDGKWLPH